jgi:hypothetical protein
MEGDHSGRDLAVRTSAAALTAFATLLGADAAAAATAMQPVTESALLTAVGWVRQRWSRNRAEVLADAADAAGKSAEDLLLAAASDDRRHELLARALGIAQDTALHNKRRALGRALAAGITGNDAHIDGELMFMRAVADLDAPHIRALALMASEQPGIGQQSSSPFHAGWSPATMAARDPGLGPALPALLSTLEAHGLIGSPVTSAPWLASREAYNVTPAGRHLLGRLAEDLPEPLQLKQNTQNPVQ